MSGSEERKRVGVERGWGVAFCSAGRRFVGVFETGVDASAGASSRVLVATGVAGVAAVVSGAGLRIGDLNGLDSVAAASTRRRLLGG